MNTLSKFLGVVSSVAFALLLLSFILKNFQSLPLKTFQMLSIIAWGALALVSLLEGFLFNGKNKIFVILTSLAISATAVLILSKIMNWPNFEKLQYTPYLCIGTGVLLFLIQRNLSGLVTNALIVGTLGILVVMEKL